MPLVQTAVVAPRQNQSDDTPTAGTRQPPSHPTLPVIHHTPARYLVVNKPPDVRIDGDFQHTVEKLALQYLQTHDNVHANGFSVRFIHRLDYATSGVILLGLGRVAAGVAATQFERRQVDKQYIALVHGHIPLSKGDRHGPQGAKDGESSESPGALFIDDPIADGLPKGSYHMVVGHDGNEGRAARTVCTPLQLGEYRGRPVTKVCLKPETGRRHQLRVHLASRGWPIVGDATYAEVNDHHAFGDFIVPRMMLHARHLTIRLAVDELYGRKSGLRTAKPFEFEAEDPFTHESLHGLKLYSSEPR